MFRQVYKAFLGIGIATLVAVLALAFPVTGLRAMEGQALPVCLQTLAPRPSLTPVLPLTPRPPLTPTASATATPAPQQPALETPSTPLVLLPETGNSRVGHAVVWAFLLLSLVSLATACWRLRPRRRSL